MDAHSKALHDGVGETKIQWEGESGSRPLVDRQCILNEGEWAQQTPPNRTWILWSIGSLSGIWIWITRNRRRWQIPTMVWFGASGLLSLFFILCWLISPLEGYGFNENWFSLILSI